MKYLVDSKVKLSEFEYAEQNKIPYENFEQAFFSIVYDEKRVQSSNFALDWGYPTYTLQDIEQHGGICVDQAYYASELGKGRASRPFIFTDKARAAATPGSVISPTAGSGISIVAATPAKIIPRAMRSIRKPGRR